MILVLLQLRKICAFLRIAVQRYTILVVLKRELVWIREIQDVVKK